MGSHPVERVRSVTISTPANTAQTAPQSTNWTCGQGVLERVDIVIPDGHQLLTGLQILWGGRQVVPYDGAEFIQGDGDEITVRLGLWVQTGVLVVRTFNADDTFAHAFLLRSYVVELDTERGLFVPLPAVPAAELGPPPELPGFLELGLTDEELATVSTALDAFLSDLSAILDGFLSELQATLGVSTQAPPPAPVEAPAAGAQVQVPDVVGMQQTPAASALRAAGFTVTVKTKVDPTKPRYLIVAQAPRGGAAAPAGSAVTVTSIRHQ